MKPCGSCIGGLCDHHMKLSVRQPASIGQRPIRVISHASSGYQQIEVPLDREAPVHDVHLGRQREPHVLVEREEQQHVARARQHRPGRQRDQHHQRAPSTREGCVAPRRRGKSTTALAVLVATRRTDSPAPDHEEPGQHEEHVDAEPEDAERPEVERDRVGARRRWRSAGTRASRRPPARSLPRRLSSTGHVLGTSRSRWISPTGCGRAPAPETGAGTTAGLQEAGVTRRVLGGAPQRIPSLGTASNPLCPRNHKIPVNDVGRECRAAC